MSTTAAPLFRFVQLEYPWALGPTDGRYVLRGHAGVPEHVLMLATLGAAERRGLLGGRKKKARSAGDAAEPTPVVTTRATLVGADPFGTRLAADQWRAQVDAEAEARKAVRVLNRVLHAHRVAAADPHVQGLDRSQAIAARVGVGEGEPLAHGHWTTAVELPPVAETRVAVRSSQVLRPQERLAAILGGRDVALACEDLTLRCRADHDDGRSREAALQLRVALECALAELAPWADKEQVGSRLAGLRDERASVAAAANSAINGGLDLDAAEEVERVLLLLEAALRARTMVGLD